MGITATAKTKVGIGSTTAHATVAEYAADTFVPIAHLTDVGEAGSEAEILTRKHVDQEFALKLKGTRDNGTMSLVVDRDSDDPGYQALIAAEKTPHAYAFEVVLNDAPSAGASPKGSVFYFHAVVASARNAFGGPDDVVSTTFALAISGPIIEVAASATAP